MTAVDPIVIVFVVAIRVNTENVLTRDMVSLQRWQRAQAGESESWAHEETWDASDIRAYFEGEFGIDISTFANEKILVVGSGTGVVHTLPIDCYAVGVDPLTNDFLDVIEDSDAHLITGVGERLPFAANTFNAVWTFNVIDHMRNPKGAIDEMYRVVQLGGELYLDANCFSLPSAVRRRMGRVDRLHPYHFAPSQVRSTVGRAGFDISHFEARETRIGDVSGPLKAKVKTAVAKYLFRFQQVTLIGRKPEK